MTEISQQRLLQTWELGHSWDPEQRVQALLGLCEPQKTSEEIAEVPLGERNSILVTLHQRLFGSQLEAATRCGKCDEALDFALPLDQLGFEHISASAQRQQVRSGNLSALVRLPNGNDMKALYSLTSVTEAQATLFQRCILEITRKDAPVTLAELTEEEFAQLEDAITKSDPRMEILLDLQCPECSHRWQATLELGMFIWSALDIYARRLLEEVHLLASIYGWSEQSILCMNPQRRNYYVRRLIQ